MTLTLWKRATGELAAKDGKPTQCDNCPPECSSSSESSSSESSSSGSSSSESSSSSSDSSSSESSDSSNSSESQSSQSCVSESSQSSNSSESSQSSNSSESSQSSGSDSDSSNSQSETSGSLSISLSSNSISFPSISSEGSSQSSESDSSESSSSGDGCEGGGYWYWTEYFVPPGEPPAGGYWTLGATECFSACCACKKPDRDGAYDGEIVPCECTPGQYIAGCWIPPTLNFVVRQGPYSEAQWCPSLAGSGTLKCEAAPGGGIRWAGTVTLGIGTITTFYVTYSGFLGTWLWGYDGNELLPCALACGNFNSLGYSCNADGTLKDIGGCIGANNACGCTSPASFGDIYITPG